MESLNVSQQKTGEVNTGTSPQWDIVKSPNITFTKVMTEENVYYRMLNKHYIALSYMQIIKLLIFMTKDKT